MLQSICDWRLRMAEAFQGANHHIQGLNFFLKKIYSQYARNIQIYILRFLIRLLQKRNCDTYISMLLFLSALSGQKISALNFLKLNVILD